MKSLKIKLQDQYLKKENVSINSIISRKIKIWSARIFSYLLVFSKIILMISSLLITPDCLHNCSPF